MIVRIERVVPFPRDAVYAWWTDFLPDDHPGPPSPATSAREIVKRDGNQLWLRERARRPAPVTLEEHVVLDPPKGYAVEARYPAAVVRYEYRFEPSAEGTRIRPTAEVMPRHVGRVLVPLFAARIRRYAERDTDYHLAKMTADLTGPGGAPGRLR